MAAFGWLGYHIERPSQDTKIQDYMFLKVKYHRKTDSQCLLVLFYCKQRLATHVRYCFYKATKLHRYY